MTEPTILHQDRHLVIVGKPSGLDVHGRGPEDRTSLVAVVARALGIPARRLHPAARLDKPVSGVVPLARSKIARQSLTQQYQRRAVKRTYVALCLGVPTPARGRLDGAIGVDGRDRRRRVVGGRDARPAVTNYQVVRELAEGCSLVELQPQTGRTHQLRVHLSQLARCPILGDRRYGGPTTLSLDDGAVVAARRVMLHARKITLTHPETGEVMTVEAPFPKDYELVIDLLSS